MQNWVWAVAIDRLSQEVLCAVFGNDRVLNFALRTYNNEAAGSIQLWKFNPGAGCRLSGNSAVMMGTRFLYCVNPSRSVTSNLRIMFYKCIMFDLQTFSVSVRVLFNSFLLDGFLSLS